MRVSDGSAAFETMVAADALPVGACELDRFGARCVVGGYREVFQNPDDRSQGGSPERRLEVTHHRRKRCLTRH